MSYEVSNTKLHSMTFDDLGVLEINDPNLLAAVAAAAQLKQYSYGNDW